LMSRVDGSAPRLEPPAQSRPPLANASAPDRDRGKLGIALQSRFQKASGYLGAIVGMAGCVTLAAWVGVAGERARLFGAGFAIAFIVSTTVFIFSVLSLAAARATRRSDLSRERMEREVFSAQERFFKAFTASANPASITTVATGEYIDVNESFLQATGFSRDEVIGRTSSELGIWIEPGQRADIVQALTAGQPIRNLEHRYKNKTGEERVWLLCADLIDIEGQTCIIGTRTDITDRKRIEEALTRSETSFRELFSNNPVPMWVFEKRGRRFLQVNDAAVERYGYSREEFLGMIIDQIRPADEVPALADLIEKHAGESRVTEEVRHLTRDGRVIDVHIVAQDFEMEGRPARLVVAYDVTEQKRAALEITQINL